MRYGSDKGHEHYVDLFIRAVPGLVGVLFLLDSMNIFNPEFLYYIPAEEKMMYVSGLLIFCSLIFIFKHFTAKKSPY